ncbi:MAG: 4-hydroxybenzoyl-CoA reductase subunit beta, partial [Planctomycetota bacterium]
AVAQATGLVAGPQLRAMGTLGGNVMLDTRCQWYNQTYFWRQSLGFCLKKDGDVCHVVDKGKRCVAAASNDSVPALMSLDASIILQGPDGRREVSLDDFWLPDGIYNKKLERTELLVEIRIPATARGHRGAYGKLRDRGSIDFPLLGVAVRLDVDETETIQAAEAVFVALVARPVRLKRLADILVGVRIGSDAWNDAVDEAGKLAYAQCRPMANIPGDHEYRRDMAPVYMKRTLRAAAEQSGPVHHI